MASQADSSEADHMENVLFKKLSFGDIEGVKNILLQGQIDINCVDENGMTPLQHVCYKGNKEFVQMLLDRGADVNAGKHESSYTALHFAALSGNVDVCQMILAAGAKSHATNSVGRTAGQMAAFVGNHSCVAVINNFVPQSSIDYYTQPHDLETEPKLLPIIASPLHKLIMQVNVNPVRVGLTVKGCALLDNIPSVCRVLDLMSEKEMKRGQETNEVLSFKFHYLSFVLNAIEKSKTKASSKKGEQEGEGASKDPVETFVRKLLQTNASGVPEYQEKLLKECIRGFPHREGALLRQMVASLTHESSGCESALTVVAMTINGPQMGRQARPIGGGGGGREREAVCEACGDWDKQCKACARCKSVLYCGKECQRLHWFVHKKVCTPALQEASPANPPTGQPGGAAGAVELGEEAKKPEKEGSAEGTDGGNQKNSVEEVQKKLEGLECNK